MKLYGLRLSLAIDYGMSHDPIKAHFAIHEVVVLSGFTKYMLDYLAREDIFRPGKRDEWGRGRRRLYSYEDVVLLRALHKICAGKGKISHLKASLKSYRQKMGPLRPGQDMNRLLVVQGNKLCTYDDGARPLELVTGQLTLSFVVDLGVVSKEVDKLIILDPKSQLITLSRAARLKADAERQRIWGPIKARRELAA